MKFYDTIARSGPAQSLVFEKDVIDLDIPKGGCIQDDWKITPTIPPKVGTTVYCLDKLS